jgi:OOP family OmpA-OmpF porin
MLCLFVLSGCSSTEILLNQPHKQDETSIPEYDTGLHKRSIHIFDPVNLAPKIITQQLQQKVQNLYVLLDSSDHMQEEYREIDKVFYAREILRRFNKTLPPTEVTTLNGNVYEFRGGMLNAIYPHSDFSNGIFDNRSIAVTLNTNKVFDLLPGQNLAVAIDHLAEYISTLPGRSSVVIITDWNNIDKASIEAVKRLRQRTTFDAGISVSSNVFPWRGKIGEGVCLYTVGLGNNYSRSVFDEMGTCGFSVAADKIAQPHDMAHFVERVIYAGPKDSDRDGIFDFKDKCPDTPPNRIVDFDGCPKFVEARQHSKLGKFIDE